MDSGGAVRGRKVPGRDVVGMQQYLKWEVRGEAAENLEGKDEALVLNLVPVQTGRFYRWSCSRTCAYVRVFRSCARKRLHALQWDSAFQPQPPLGLVGVFVRGVKTNKKVGGFQPRTNQITKKGWGKSKTLYREISVPTTKKLKLY